MRAALALAVLPLLGGCGMFGWFKADEGVTPPAELVEFTPAERIVEHWSRNAGSGPGKQFYRLGPALAGDAVYVVDRRGRVSAYRTADGKRLWRTKLDRAVSSTPAVGAGLVIVGTPQGEVIALDAAGGVERWVGQTPSEVLAPPALDAGVVVVQTADGRLTGLDADDGRRLWSQERSEPPLSLRGTGAPLAVGGLVLSGFASGKLAAFQLRDGRLVWEIPVAQPSGRSEVERLVDVDVMPIVVDRTLYAAAYQGRVAALNLENGRLLWSREISTYNDLVADGGNLYVSDDQGVVWALDLRTGSTVWKQDKLLGRRPSAPASTALGIVVGDFEGYVHWLARDDGRFLARHRPGSAPIVAKPVADGDTVFISAQNGRLTALGPRRP
ncbi:MAG TPA: outer membrane protein assembly factor BamB [Acidiferrobacterales bacterium]|jgi:outer membrane protein assembly factor BamB